MSRPWYFKVNKEFNKIKFWRNKAAPSDEKRVWHCEKTYT